MRKTRIEHGFQCHSFLGVLSHPKTLHQSDFFSEEYPTLINEVLSFRDIVEASFFSIISTFYIFSATTAYKTQSWSLIKNKAIVNTKIERKLE